MRSTQNLSSRANVLLAKTGILSHYANNATIYSQGAPADAIFYIQKGLVMLTVKTTGRRPAVVAVLGPGSFFNELCLLDYFNCMSSATAITSSAILAIKKAEMIRLLSREKVVSAVFSSFLLSSTVRFREDLLDVLVNSSEQRLARALLRLEDLNEKDRSTLELPKISQQVLAEMVGTTRSRISMFMNRFRRRGFIRYNGGLEVRGSLRTVLQDEKPTVIPGRRHRIS